MSIDAYQQLKDIIVAGTRKYACTGTPLSNAKKANKASSLEGFAKRLCAELEGCAPEDPGGPLNGLEIVSTRRLKENQFPVARHLQTLVRITRTLQEALLPIVTELKQIKTEGLELNQKTIIGNLIKIFNPVAEGFPDILQPKY